MILQAPVRDKLEPVVFNLSLSLDEQKPKSRRSLQNLDFFPILSQEQKLTQKTEVWSGAYTVTFSITVDSEACICDSPTVRYYVTLFVLFLQINFQKECGTDNKCSSNLQLTAQFVDKADKPYPR